MQTAFVFSLHYARAMDGVLRPLYYIYINRTVRQGQHRHPQKNRNQHQNGSLLFHYYYVFFLLGKRGRRRDRTKDDQHIFINSLLARMLEVLRVSRRADGFDFTMWRVILYVGCPLADRTKWKRCKSNNKKKRCQSANCDIDIARLSGLLRPRVDKTRLMAAIQTVRGIFAFRHQLGATARRDCGR